MNRTFAYSVVVLSVALLVYIAMRPDGPRSVVLSFDPAINGEPLVFGDYRYQNPGGDGVFKVNDFRFFLSDIRLFDGAIEQPDIT